MEAYQGMLPLPGMDMPPPVGVNPQVHYVYDGSLDGLLCCIFAAFFHKEDPRLITPEAFVQCGLDTQLRRIQTQEDTARRVERGILQKIGPECFARMQILALSGDPAAARVALAYVRRGFEVGPRIDQRLAEVPVHDLNRLVRAVEWEAARYRQFLRFEELEGGVFFAEMEPEHDVLVLVMPHFCDRFGQQPFLLHDVGRGLAGVWDLRDWTVVSDAQMRLPPRAAQEATYQALWRTFYDSIAIRQRVNPALRRQHMPKKFWRYMTEMQPVLPGKGVAARLGDGRVWGEQARRYLVMAPAPVNPGSHPCPRRVLYDG